MAVSCIHPYVIINNRSNGHGNEGRVIDQRIDGGIREYLVLFADGNTDIFMDHEVETIDQPSTQIDPPTVPRTWEY